MFTHPCLIFWPMNQLRNTLVFFSNYIETATLSNTLKNGEYANVQNDNFRLPKYRCCYFLRWLHRLPELWNIKEEWKRNQKIIDYFIHFFFENSIASNIFTEKYFHYICHPSKL
jgi:hypothetical protein